MSKEDSCEDKVCKKDGDECGDDDVKNNDEDEDEKQPAQKRRHTESEDGGAEVKKEDREIEEQNEDEKKKKNEEIDGVLMKLRDVFRSCVKNKTVKSEGGDPANVFSVKKYCTACCAGARMLMKKVGTDGNHNKCWFEVIENAAIAFHEGCPFPDSLAELLKSATTGEGYAAIEGSWFGLIETLKASELLKHDEIITSGQEGWDCDTVKIWRTEFSVVRQIEAADDAITLDRSIAPIIHAVNDRYNAVASAKSVAVRDCLDETETATLIAKAHPSRHEKALWIRCVASCAMLCLQQTKMFWAPKCLDTLVQLFVDRRASLFTKEELATIEKWQHEAHQVACAKRSGTGLNASLERESQFDRDLHRWQTADVPRGKATSHDYF